MSYEHKEWQSTWVIHPSEYAIDYSKELGIPLNQLHKRLGVAHDELDSFLRGNTPVTPSLAPKLGKVLGFDGGFWLRLQRSYDRTIERNNAREAAGINTTVYKMLDADGRTVKYGMSTDLADAWDEEELAGNGVELEPLSWYLHTSVAQRKLDKLQRAFEARKMREREAVGAQVIAQAA